MRAPTLRGKLTQLSNLPVSKWMAFTRGWVSRERTGAVPCALPYAKHLLQIPIREFYDSYWFFCESEVGTRELTFFLKHLSAGDVFYDIGGFRGAYGAAAKAALGDSVKVHLFEPIQENWQAIEAISKLNQFAGFEIVRLAVGCDLAVKGVFNEKDRMFRDGDASVSSAAREIPATSLDAYVTNSKQIPSIIKIDVDGFELQVLSSGLSTLSQFKPRLWMELHPNYLSAQGRNWEEAIEMLKSIGYRTIIFYQDFSLETRDVSFHVWCEA